MPQNDDNLISVVSRYRLTLPSVRQGYDVLPWRFGGNRKGRLPSFDMEVTLLCTNGVVAWFLREDGSTFWGHLGNFVEGDRVEKVPAFWRVGAARKREKKVSRVEQLLADL